MYWKEEDSTNTVEQSIHEGDGVIKIRGLFDEVSRLPIRLQVWELAPGASEGSHSHEGSTPLEEIYYFLEGHGIMWIDGKDVPIGPGDALLVPPGVNHGFRNIGDVPLKLVIIWGRPLD